MEQTPLELYETAYRLHYTEHRIADAVLYYQRLIKEFPDANECGYAAIQLQKIKASDVASDIASVMAGGKRKSSLEPVLLAVCILTLAVCGYVFYTVNRHVNTEEKRVGLALNALSKFSRGNHEDALKLLSEMKMMKIDDIMPYELSADIYRMDNKFDLARKEYTTFFQLNPSLQPSENEQWFMDLTDGKRSKSKSTAKSAPVEEAAEAAAPPPPPSPSKKAPARVKKKGAAVPPPPGKKGGKLFLVDPDSLSYF